MAEVNNLSAGGLQDPAHDIDRRVMAIKQGTGGDDSNFICGMIRDFFFHIIHSLPQEQGDPLANLLLSDKLPCGKSYLEIRRATAYHYG
jgi:hypothetical protein